MGRTVPTWRNRIESEMTSLEPFRRALNSGDKLVFDELLNGVRKRRTAGGMLPAHDAWNSGDKIAFDELLNGVRKRRTAGGMLPAHDAWKPMLMSMLIECHSRIAELEQRIESLSEA